MDRRDFLFGSVAVAATAACPHIGQAVEGPSELSIHETHDARKIPVNYCGLSYELSELTRTEFFSAANHALVAHFRRLSPNGVLRLGGNSSEFCWFKANEDSQPPKLHIPPDNLQANWMPHRLFAIEPRAIDELAGFLHATRWRLIYGLNFGNSTPERAATEASYVAERLGDRLEYFQIGNEPDFYHDANNGTRPAGWDFDDYVREWTRFAHTISARVPAARFGGPDVGASSDWVTRFADCMPALVGERLVALTGHYYAMGPPNDPRVTIERLLRDDPRVAEDMRRIEDAARPRSLAYRMTEGNSCYRGGKPGMSDAFASALWVGSYMLELASLGCSGVNLHGGSSAILSAGLGDHTPGLEVAKTPQAVRAGFYTPIQSEPNRPLKAMPIFYGMMLANQLAGGVLLDAQLRTGGANASAYATAHGQTIKVAVFNKDAVQDLDLLVHLPAKPRIGSAWRLDAPALDATEGVCLAGAAIDAEGEWNPHDVENVHVADRTASILLPAASGVLLFFES